MFIWGWEWILEAWKQPWLNFELLTPRNGRPHLTRPVGPGGRDQIAGGISVTSEKRTVKKKKKKWNIKGKPPKYSYTPGRKIFPISLRILFFVANESKSHDTWQHSPVLKQGSAKVRCRGAGLLQTLLSGVGDPIQQGLDQLSPYIAFIL